MPSSFNVQIIGLDKLMAAAREVSAQMPNILYTAMVKATNLVAEDAKRIKPGSFKNQTGNLRSSIFRRVESYERGIIGVGESYGQYVEFGTAPHLILPRVAKALAFPGPTGTIFAKVVHHPGSRPYPFMEPALMDNLSNIQRIYEEAADIIVKGMAT